MKPKIFVLAIGLIGIATAGAVPLSVPAGSFENGTSSDWSPATSGLATTSFPSESGNTFGRISVTGLGTGSLTDTTPAAFAPDSLYVVSLDLRSASLLDAEGSFGIQILDGDGNVVAELSRDELVGLLGIDLDVVPNLTTDLTGLVGKTDLVAALQNLLFHINGDPDLLASIHQLVGTLIGADPSVVGKVADLLGAVLNGSTDPDTLTAVNIADILELQTTDPIVAAVANLLNFTAGDDGPLQATVDLLHVLLGAPGDTTLVHDLLALLLGHDGLVANVANILAYALSDENLLGTLDDTLTESLLGVVDPNSDGFQTVKLLFSTASSAPEGAIGVRLHAGSSAALGMAADFDNVGIEQYPLAVTGDPNDPNNPGGGTVNNNGTYPRPVLRVRGGRQARSADSSRIVLRGKARARGVNNEIQRVEYKVRGKGVSNHHFRRARGREQWKIVLHPHGQHLRVRIRAIDLNNRKSIQRIVIVK